MRFAYLIMAHNNAAQLKNLLTLLDWEENDIFLHIDKKSKVIDEKELEGVIKKAQIHIYKEIKVFWGDISQTKCQFFLMEKAIEKHHDYYHLLSGSDLPIKRHDEIMNFFKANEGKQFIHFESNVISENELCKYYHLGCSRMQRTRHERIKKIWRGIDNIGVAIQKKMHMGRTLYRGANWFSITHELAKDLVYNKARMLKKIRWTISSDECVLQTFVKCVSKKSYELYYVTKSEYEGKAMVREIDWKRGNPYVWKAEDYDALMMSDSMFARKFDENIDNRIIEKISQYLSI